MIEPPLDEPDESTQSERMEREEPILDPREDDFIETEYEKGIRRRNL